MSDELSTGYTVAQTWGMIRKLWRRYKIAKAQNDLPTMKDVQEQINIQRRALGMKELEWK